MVFEKQISGVPLLDVLPSNKIILTLVHLQHIVLTRQIYTQ